MLIRNAQLNLEAEAGATAEAHCPQHTKPMTGTADRGCLASFQAEPDPTIAAGVFLGTTIVGQN